MSDQKIFNAIMRQNLPAFIKKVFQTISPGETYLDNWHIEAIAHYLTMCFAGRIQRLIITLPPRYLKSISASVAFPAWVLGHYPEDRIICVSYSQDLANKLSQDTRTIMESGWYKNCFTRTRLHPKKNTVSEFTTTKMGYRLATSIGGSLTGRGGNLIIIDDPHKADEAASDTAREGVINWFKNTLLSRLDNKKEDVIILIQQRLHENDLAGYLLNTGGWIHLNLPAIAEVNESIPVGPDRYHHRRNGDVLHEERESMTLLEQIRNSMGPYLFAAQYQQRPSPIEGGLIKWDWFKNRFTPPLKRQQDDILIQSWDTASSVGEMNDYSVCITCLIKNGVFHIANVYRARLEFPALRNAVLERANKDKPNAVLIEYANAGISLLQELRRENHNFEFYPIRPEGSKADRMIGVSPMIESGRVLLPHQSSWLEDFRHEMVTFPEGKHDDQVDSLSQLLDWYRCRGYKTQLVPMTCYAIGRDARYRNDTSGPRLTIDDIFNKPFSGKI